MRGRIPSANDGSACSRSNKRLAQNPGETLPHARARKREPLGPGVTIIFFCRLLEIRPALIPRTAGSMKNHVAPPLQGFSRANQRLANPFLGTFIVGQQSTLTS